MEKRRWIFNLPDYPGIGMNVDFKRLINESSKISKDGKKFPNERKLENIPIRNDGSVGYSV